MTSAIPCSLFPPISRIHSSLFSDWTCIVSSKFFDTQVPSISTEELVLFLHAHCALSRLRCNTRRLLLSSYLTRIGRIEDSSCSVCGHSSQDTSHLILHCPATDSLPRSLFGDFLSLRPLVQALGSFPASGAPWSFAMPPSLGRGRVTTTTSTIRWELQHAPSIHPGNEFIPRSVMPTPRTQRNLQSRVTALPDQLDDFNDHDKILDFPSIGKSLCPSGYKLQFDKSRAVFCKLKSCETLDFPTVTKAIVIENDLHVKLFFSGSTVLLPPWLVKERIFE